MRKSSFTNCKIVLLNTQGKVFKTSHMNNSLVFNSRRKNAKQKLNAMSKDILIMLSFFEMEMLERYKGHYFKQNFFIPWFLLIILHIKVLK